MYTSANICQYLLAGKILSKSAFIYITFSYSTFSFYRYTIAKSHEKKKEINREFKSN